jgi:hypothetical protein
MRPWTITNRVFITLAILGALAGCGGGGSSAGGSIVATAVPPVTSAIAVTPPDNPLSQFKQYTFSASATDSTVGRTVASFIWHFGDGTAPKTVTAVNGACSVTHSFQNSGSFTVDVQSQDSQGLLGNDVQLPETVNSSPSPVTVTVITPPAAQSLQVQIPGTVVFTFVVNATTSSTGATIAPSNLAFNPGDPLTSPAASVGTITAGSGGNFNIPVTFSAAASTGSRTANPTLTVSDNQGDQSAPVTLPAITIISTGANHPPTILITTPASPSTSGFTSKPVNLGFTVTDLDNDPITYSVNWGHVTALTTGSTGTATTTSGVPVSLTHAYADSFTSSTKAATVTVTANDGRTPAPLPTASCTFSITYNTYPTATITTPQASSTLPSTTALPSGTPAGLVNPPTANSPDLVVIPVGGKLNFSGVGTPPGSLDSTLTYTWTFQNGAPANPANATTASPGDVFFNGQTGVLTPCLVTLTVTDAFNRVSSNGPSANPNTYQKWVIVDGTNTQDFDLAFLYRQRSGTSALDTYSYAQSPADGNGAEVSIFQDGMNNTYAVSSNNGAFVTIPVRSNVTFWLSIPPTVLGGTSDASTYMFSIPNAPGLDPDMENSISNGPRPLTLADGTAFAFQNATYPWNPQFQVTTATGFGTELMAADTRTFQGDLDLYNNRCDATSTEVLEPNMRWLDRLSVPTTDALPVLAFGNIFPTNASYLHAFSGIQGYQSIPEWFVFLKSVETRDVNSLVASSTPGVFGTLGSYGTISAPTDMGFVIDEKYNALTQTSNHYSVSAIQAFRAPASTSEPYDFDVMKAKATGSTVLADADVLAVNGNPNPSAGLNPTPLAGTCLDFLSGLMNTPPAGPLSGGLYSITVPYDANDVNRVPDNPTTYHPYNTDSSFSYAEYLWTKVWARPLVLNRTSLNWFDTRNFSSNYILSNPTAADECTANAATQSLSFPFFFYSNPSNPWPNVGAVSPDNSAYDLNVTNGGTFDASSPVTEGGLTGTSTGVGRFFWTAFAPHFNAVNGSLISRTWLADGVTNPSQIPITFNGTTTDAVTAWGFLPPQDVNVDKRARGADGLPLASGALGGFRVIWCNPTLDSLGLPVPPDFWAVELADGTNVQIFLLSANYPRTTTQALTDSLMTDARSFLPSGQATFQTGDLVGPGYCWFDVPPELRPAAGTTATLTVFGLKSILKNHAVASARVINRTEWVEAVKTVTASISTKPGGNDVSFAHKIPFNYPWDIVVVNGPVTSVAP